LAAVISAHEYANEPKIFYDGIYLITLRAKVSGAVYCYRSCLFATGGQADWRTDRRRLWRAGGVCYHDNSKLRASIFTKLGL